MEEIVLKPVCDKMEAYSGRYSQISETNNWNISNHIDVRCERYILSSDARKKRAIEIKRFREYKIEPIVNGQWTGEEYEYQKLPDGYVGYYFPVVEDDMTTLLRLRGARLLISKSRQGKAVPLFSETLEEPNQTGWCSPDVFGRNCFFAKQKAIMVMDDWSRISNDVHSAFNPIERFGNWDVHKDGRFIGGHRRSVLRFPVCVRGHAFLLQFIEWVIQHDQPVKTALGVERVLEKDSKWTEICMVPVESYSQSKNLQIDEREEMDCFVTCVMKDAEDTVNRAADILTKNLVQRSWTL